jgi:anti-sigma factor RsiW
MSCREWEAKLTDWVLNELSSTEAEELERHLKQCPECARSVSRLRGVHEKLALGLTDLPMPARLVFWTEKPEGRPTAVLTQLWRSAAMGAVAGVVFLVVSWSGLTYRGGRVAMPSPSEEVKLNRAEVKALAAQVVAEQLSVHRREEESAREMLADSLRQETMSQLAQAGQELAYVQTVQNAVWKRTEQQNAVVEQIARNYLEPLPAQGGKP